MPVYHFSIRDGSDMPDPKFCFAGTLPGLTEQLARPLLRYEISLR